MKRIILVVMVALLLSPGLTAAADPLGCDVWSHAGNVLLCAVVEGGNGRFYVSPKGTKIWQSPTGGWEVLTNFMARDLSEIREFVGSKPRDADVAKMYEIMVSEPGVWMGFSIRFGRIQRVVFTKNTKVVLFDRDGRRHESEACLFSPDLMQTRVFDSRKAPVVVSRHSVWCHSKHGLPVMDVKFRSGEFELKDLVEFEVVGAVEDTIRQATE